MQRKDRPFIEDGSQFGVSRTEFRRAPKARKVELMKEWFFQNFEDPANSTPYISAEGGYQWIWGGPYEAKDELYGKFGGIVPETWIDEVTEDIESEGIVDWAPVHTDDDYDEKEPDEPPSLDIFLDEPGPRYGTPEEQEARARARQQIEDLRNALERPREIGIGHNQPPADEEEEPEEIKELRPALAALSAELAKPNPAIALVKKWTTPLRKAVIACGKWGWKRVETALDAGIKTAATGTVAWAGVHYQSELLNAYNAVVDWLQIVASTRF